MSDPLGDWLDWKRQEAEKWRVQVQVLRGRLATIDHGIRALNEERPDVERQLRHAECELEVAQNYGD